MGCVDGNADATLTGWAGVIAKLYDLFSHQL